MAEQDGLIPQSKIASATRWSFAGEIAANLVAPITNMILARLLAPEIFGIIATINMVVSFSDIFTQAGFHLYLVQHEFDDEEELKKYASSALWVSIFIGLLIFSVISIFSDTIAALVGSSGHGKELIAASIAIPISAAISILQAIYRRNLNFKLLFVRRLLGLVVPLIITVPLAASGLGVWALIIGTLAGKLVNLVALLSDKHYRPRFFCSFSRIGDMVPYSVTNMVSFSLSWAINWIDIFIIGNILGLYYTGLYKNSQSIVIGILTMFTTALTPVLFSVLSRYANDDNRFKQTMFEFTEKVSFLLLPIGFGMLVCRRLITFILLGSNWMEAADFIGIWGLCTVFSAVYATYCREALRAKGKPHLNIVAQIISLFFIVPASYFGAKMGFHALIYFRSAASLTLIGAYYVILYVRMDFNPVILLKASYPYFVASFTMAIILFLLKTINCTIWFEAILVLAGIVIYFSVLCLFPQKRLMLVGLVKNIRNTIREKLWKRSK